MKKTLLLAILVGSLCFLSACGASGGSSTGSGGSPAGTYTFSVLHSFTGQPDGGHPSGGLILDAAGDLYGTTVSGGSAGAGTVFKLDSTGKESVLYNFAGGVDGGSPLQARLVLDAAGNLYGTAVGGGVIASACNGSCGLVFKLDPTTGTETVLYRFAGADGASPEAGLARDAAGNLYGTTTFGGLINGGCGPFGCGVVFKLDMTGKQTVLHTFTKGADGQFPEGDLFRDSAGNLYGTTLEGGGAADAGVVFKLDPAGTESVLHGFTKTDGSSPSEGLIQDAMGNFFGTTFSGGIGCGASTCGVVFKLDPTTGMETVLYSFTGGADGGGPFAGLVQDAAGNFYGTTGSGGTTGGNGGSFGNGVVFKLDITGKEIVLHSFTDGPDGAGPHGGLVRDSAGNLYGTTVAGGISGCSLEFGTTECGVVFKLTLAH